MKFLDAISYKHTTNKMANWVVVISFEDSRKNQTLMPINNGFVGKYQSRDPSELTEGCGKFCRVVDICNIVQNNVTNIRLDLCKSPSYIIFSFYFL